MAKSAPVLVLDKPLHCVVCENTSFEERKAQLNTKVASFFDFDWANPEATCYVCDRCGYIHWFMPTS